MKIIKYFKSSDDENFYYAIADNGKLYSAYHWHGMSMPDDLHWHPLISLTDCFKITHEFEKLMPFMEKIK